MCFGFVGTFNDEMRLIFKSSNQINENLEWTNKKQTKVFLVCRICTTLSIYMIFVI